MLLLRPRQSFGAAAGAGITGAGAVAAAEPRCPGRGLGPRVRPNWWRASRALSTLTHPHMHIQTFLAPHPNRSGDPTKTATTNKAFTTFAPSLSPQQPPSSSSPSLSPPLSPNYTTRQQRDRLNWRAPPPSLCRFPLSPTPSSRYSTSPTMADKWTALKVRETFFEFFAERGHNIGMSLP